MDPVIPDDEEEEEDDYRLKYHILEKEFETYKKHKEREMDILRKELENTQDELSDITQIKLDKLIKNQQNFQNQLLLCLNPNDDSIHAHMCEDFLRSTPYKKRKSTTGDD